MKMIVTDLDGTLLRSDGTISDYTADVFNRCRAAGCKIVFATARPLRTTLTFQNIIPVDAVITNNGAAVFAGGQLISEKSISPEICAELTDLFLSFESVTGIAFERGEHLETNDEVFLGKDSSWNAVFCDLQEVKNKPALKIGVGCEDAGLIHEITGRYSELHVHTIDGENWHLITRKDASKTNGIKTVAEYFGIDVKDIIAFGDDYNDVEMIRFAGVGVAMGNAVPEVTAAADITAEDNNHDGAASVLQLKILQPVSDERPKIEIRDLHKSFGDKKILKGVDLRIYKGEILCIIGPSGTGKSVILKNIIGLLEPDAGEIFIDGELFSSAVPSRKFELQKQFGVLFQGAALFDSMNVFDNVAFGLRRKNIPERDISQIVPGLLEDVGLKNIGHIMPSELSGGMQKRVGLARSIALQPSVMLYDEPTTGVDPITAGAVDRLIVKMNRTHGITSVVITHDIKSACSIASRIIMLSGGMVYFTGSADDLKKSQDPYIRQFVEGRANR